MTIAFEQSVTLYDSTPTANPTLTVASTGAGSLLILGANINNGSLLSSVTDNKGNTWTQIDSLINGDGSSLSLWYAWNATAGVTSVIAHTSGAPVSQYIFMEFGGVQTSSNPQDNHAHTTTTSTSPQAAVSLTPAAANELFVELGQFNTAGGTPSFITNINSSFTFVGGPNPPQYPSMGYFISSNSATQSPGWISSTNQTVYSIGVCFKPSSAVASSGNMFMVF